MQCRLIAGGVAGMVSRASVAPFERMRTMYMVRQADGKSLSMGGEVLWPFYVPSSFNQTFFCQEKWDSNAMSVCGKLFAVLVRSWKQCL